MYWSEKWKVPIIAMAMTRNRFFFIRLRLKCVYDSEVSAVQKIQKTWKIQPLFQRILNGCHEQNRPKEMSIDEMIIPFTGKCPMRQYCPNKPNPVGLKVFVLATPQGVVCDMVVYQGDTTFPDLIGQGFGLGEAAVLTLTRTLVPGHLLFFDRFFTSTKLCDELLRRGFHGTGTIMKNRVPKSCVLTEEKVFRKKARGSSEVKVREDGKIAVTMWLDNKPVLMMSTCYCDQNHDECERWSKKDKRYERVRRPEVIKTYNQNMGGVDLTDRMLSVCPSRNRTKKWTIRVISHLFDLAVVNAWLQYRAVQIEKGAIKRNIIQMRQYKLDLGTKLIGDNEEQSDGESGGEEYEELEPKHKKRKILIKPIPSRERRMKSAAHLPEYNTKQSRCRNRGCSKKTTVYCIKCDIYLCFTPNRNCFSDFHKDAE
ncbi:piggyBac transposable element-derived protein 3-like [Pectinophora gossypiella]|uniref:piggyBac transposable element-derived protein 3-like n=1 Tax=Pectinophora gossypiella TaxID=13191 RepID=UPI00214EEBB0|nr:piggyBac transposable element-derived protein 3-like [Pectinophora gossypiella]